MNHNEFYKRYGDLSNIVHNEEGEPVIHIPLEDQYEVIVSRLRDELREEIISHITYSLVEGGTTGALYDAIKAKLIADGFYRIPKIQILHLYNQRVLFEARVVDRVELLRKAIEADALLRHADLPGLDLSTIDLRGVDTSTWNLKGSKLPVYS